MHSEMMLSVPYRSRHMELPPLLKLVMERNRAARAEKAAETGSEIRKEDKEDLLLPAYKIYDKDVRLTDTGTNTLVYRYSKMVDFGPFVLQWSRICRWLKKLGRSLPRKINTTS